MVFQNCMYCGGTGKDPNTGMLSGYKPCPVCEGLTKRSINNSKFVVTRCSYCNETGKDPNTGMLSGYKPCPVCEGWGRTVTTLSDLPKASKEEMAREDKSGKKYSNRIFIVHGHDDLPKERLANILINLGLRTDHPS